MTMLDPTTLDPTDAPPLGAPLPDWTPPPRPERAPLDGRFARLEPLDAATHGAALFDAFAADASERIWAYLPYGPYRTRAALVAELSARMRSEDPLWFAVIDRADGRAAGVLTFLRIAPEAGSIEIGHICFSPRLQRTAAASEALILPIRHAFALGYRRLEWKCNALNEGSRRAAQRLGLSYEGVFRQATVVKGRNRDTAWYAAIDGEAAALDAAYDAWLDPSNFDADGLQRRALSDLTAPLLVARG